MDKIYDLVRSIVIYLILVTIIMNLVGKSSYRKYISIFTGMVLIIIVARPLLNLFNLADTFNYYFDSNLFKIEAKDMSDELISADEAGKQAIISEYQKAVKNQVKICLERNKLYASSIEIETNMQEESMSFGNVEAIVIVAAFTREESEEEEAKIVVDKIMINEDIKIDKNGRKKQNTRQETGAYEKVKKKIKEELAYEFQISIEQIQITIIDE